MGAHLAALLSQEFCHEVTSLLKLECSNSATPNEPTESESQWWIWEWVTWAAAQGGI